MSQVKMLIIDDEINIAKTIAATFADSCYLIEICNDGLSAWNRINEESWDIAFLDIRMPVMDGMEVIKRIHDKGIRINVIMVTAYGSVDNAVQAMKYGAVDFIQKPLEPVNIRHIVMDILSRPLLAERDLTTYKEYIELAKFKITQREYSAAKNSVLKALNEMPDSAEAYNLLGALHEVMDDLGSAVQAYQMALKFDKGYKPALENISRVTSREGNTSTILELMASLRNKHQ